MAIRIPVRKRGQLTLPAKIRKEFHIDEGDIVEAEITEEGILIRPKKLIDVTQSWFWSKNWQKGEEEAEGDIGGDNLKRYDSVDDLIKGLKG